MTYFFYHFLTLSYVFDDAQSSINEEKDQNKSNEQSLLSLI